MTAYLDRPTKSAGRESRSPGASFTSVYVDLSARLDLVQAAVSQLPKPPRIDTVRIDDRALTETFGCRIAIDLTGTFDESLEGHLIGRSYARNLAALIGVPVYAFYDLVRADPSSFLY